MGGFIEDFCSKCGEKAAKANALLIAAAPDLFDACKFAVEQFDRNRNWDWPHAMELMQIAIAKAEGKT